MVQGGLFFFKKTQTSFPGTYHYFRGCCFMSPAIALPTATLDLNAIDRPELLQQGQPYQPPIPHPGHVAHSPRQDLRPDPRPPPGLPISKHSEVCTLRRCLLAKSGTVPAPDPSHFHGFSLGPLATSTDLLLLPSDLATPHLSLTYTDLLSRHLILSATYTDLPSFSRILSVPCTDACYQLLTTTSEHFRPLPKIPFPPNLTSPSSLPNGKDPSPWPSCPGRLSRAFVSQVPVPPALAQPPDQPAAQAPFPVPVPARAGRRRHPVSQAAPSLPQQPACGPRPAHLGVLTEATQLSSCLRLHLLTSPGAATVPPSLPAQAQMAAPNSAPRSDWPASLFKIRTSESGQELPV